MVLYFACFFLIGVLVAQLFFHYVSYISGKEKYSYVRYGVTIIAILVIAYIIGRIIGNIDVEWYRDAVPVISIFVGFFCFVGCKKILGKRR